MTLNEYKDFLQKIALERGCTGAQVVCAESDSFAVTVRGGEIDKYNVAASVSLTLRVVYEGHDGFASTEVFTDGETLVENAIQNAMIVTGEDEHPMQVFCEYEKIEMPQQPIARMTDSQRIDLAMEIEKRALAADSRVKRVMGATVCSTHSRALLENTQGLRAEDEGDMTYTTLNLVFDDNGEEISAFNIKYLQEAEDIDGLVEETVAECIEKIGAKPIPVGEYRVLFSNKCFCSMLGLFWDIFSAYSAQKGLTQLADKEGQMVASEVVTLCDDPHNGFYPIPFDSEGTPTQYKEIISKGKLNTLLHSMTTAKKAGVKSTGNGTASGGCAIANLLLKAGEKTKEQLLSGEKVLLITDVDGAGTGVNTISGEFSLSAHGTLYENGKKVQAVNQITVAGSFYDLLMNILAVGNDMIIGESEGMGFIGSPCVLVDKLIIAG